MSFLQDLRGLIEDDLKKKNGAPVINQNLWICMLLDFLLIQFILGPCNCFVWIGLWELLDIFIDKHNTSYNVICLSVGLSVSVPLVFFSRDFFNFSEKVFVCYKGLYIIETRIFTIITFPVIVLYWKGWFGLVSTMDPEMDVIISLACLLLGSLVLTKIGCLKTAAVTPPLGIYLDDLGKKRSYAGVRQFYKVPEDPTKNTWQFRLINACLTMVIEMLALITYFGAWESVNYVDPLHSYLIEDDNITGSWMHVTFAIFTAIIFSALSFIGSIGYLYLHYKCSSHYFSQTVKDLCYSFVLVLATIGTATHFHAWWGLSEIVTNTYFRDLDNPDQYNDYALVPEAAYFFFILMAVGLIVLLLCGGSCNLHYGLEWEVEREEAGMLLPFFYLTYLFRDKELDQVEEGIALG